MLLCLKEHSKKGSQELTFCTRIGIGFAIVETAHSHSMTKKLSKELSKKLSKKHSKKQNFYTRIGPLIPEELYQNLPAYFPHLSSFGSNSLHILASIFWPDGTTCDLILSYLGRNP